MTRSRMVFNGFEPVWGQVLDAVEAKHLEAAQALLDFIQGALDHDEFGIGTDKGALAASLYLKATGRNDYQAARDAALSILKANGGGEGGKAKRSFEDLFAARSELPDRGQNVFVAIVSTALAYGTHWETDGGRPWMTPAAFEWAQSRAKEIYEELAGELR